MCREFEDAATTSSPRGAHGEVRHHLVSVREEDHDSVMKIVLAVYTAVYRAPGLCNTHKQIRRRLGHIHSPVKTEREESGAEGLCLVVLSMFAFARETRLMWLVCTSKIFILMGWKKLSCSPIVTLLCDTLEFMRDRKGAGCKTHFLWKEHHCLETQRCDVP